MSKSETIHFGEERLLNGSQAIAVLLREVADFVAFGSSNASQSVLAEWGSSPTAKIRGEFAEKTPLFEVPGSGKSVRFSTGVEMEADDLAAMTACGGASLGGTRSATIVSSCALTAGMENLFSNVGKHLPCVINAGCTPFTGAGVGNAINHDGFFAAANAGAFQLFASTTQQLIDFNLIAFLIAETALVPGIVAYDHQFLSKILSPVLMPDKAFIDNLLGASSDYIPAPTAAQKFVFGEKRRRVPGLWDLDNPCTTGTAYDGRLFNESVAGHDSFFGGHLPQIISQAMTNFGGVTQRNYQPVMTYNCEDAEYIIIAQGYIIPSLMAVADYFRQTKKCRVGIINMVMFRPFPAARLSHLLVGRKAVTVVECVSGHHHPLPMTQSVRAVLQKCMENSLFKAGREPFAGYARIEKPKHMPLLMEGNAYWDGRSTNQLDLVAIVENMVAGTEGKRKFVLGIDFQRPQAESPKEEIYQQFMAEHYPHVLQQTILGRQNPNLLPEQSLAIRWFARSGSGIEHLSLAMAHIIFKYFGAYVKFLPAGERHLQDQVLEYNLAAAMVPYDTNSIGSFHDIVFAPDIQIFAVTDPLKTLKKRGFLLLQLPEGWVGNGFELLPAAIVTQLKVDQIRVVFLPKQTKMVGGQMEIVSPDEWRNILIGVVLSHSRMISSLGLGTKRMLALWKSWLTKESMQNDSDRAWIEKCLEAFRNGFEDIRSIEVSDDFGITQRPERREQLPIMIRSLPENDIPCTDIHHFWESNEGSYHSLDHQHEIAEPLKTMGIMPAGTSIFRDLTPQRETIPQWDPQACTGCGVCWSICPDSAIPGLITEPNIVLETAMKRVEKQGLSTKNLQRMIRTVEKKWRPVIKRTDDNMLSCLKEAIYLTVEASEPQQKDHAKLTADSMVLENEKTIAGKELDHLLAEMHGFQFAATDAFYFGFENKNKGSGGLLSITVNPFKCKGCNACVENCPEKALTAVKQSEEIVAEKKKQWRFWRDLSSTPDRFLREKITAHQPDQLAQLLLDKRVYESMLGGDSACPGCGEKTALHLFTGVIKSLMLKQHQQFLQGLGTVIDELKKHMMLKLAVEINEPADLAQALVKLGDREFTLSELANSVDQESKPVNREWLSAVGHVFTDLTQLKWVYEEGISKNGRAQYGIVNCRGCSSYWGAQYPYNPYSVPWVSLHKDQNLSVAEGLFDALMKKMLTEFKLLRNARYLLQNPKQIDPTIIDKPLELADISQEEYALIPPLIIVGGDQALGKQALQSLMGILRGSRPIKIFVLDNQLAANSIIQGTQSRYATFGSENIVALAGFLQNAFVAQCNIAFPEHLLQCIEEGIGIDRPAIFNIYCGCVPGQGYAREKLLEQSRLAVDSRLLPLAKYNPKCDSSFQACWDMSANPDANELWTTGAHPSGKSPGYPLTPADFAISQRRYKDSFKLVDAHGGLELVSMAEYLAMDAEDRQEVTPYVQGPDAAGKTGRFIVGPDMISWCQIKLDQWEMLQSLPSTANGPDNANKPGQVQASDYLSKLTESLMGYAGVYQTSGSLDVDIDSFLKSSIPVEVIPKPEVQKLEVHEPTVFIPPKLDTANCHPCDACIHINPQVFSYNEKKQAIIKNPQGPYKDFVKAAEVCKLGLIDPGYPAGNHPGIEVWIKRGKKYRC